MRNSGDYFIIFLLIFFKQYIEFVFLSEHKKTCLYLELLIWWIKLKRFNDFFEGTNVVGFIGF